MEKRSIWQNELRAIDDELQTLPEGHLKLRKGRFFTHLTSNGEVGITNNEPLLRQLGRKKYLLERKKVLEDAMSKRFKNFEAPASPRQIINALNSTYEKLPVSYFYHPSMESWLKGNFEKNSFRPEHLNYVSKGGVAFRSKSELMIGNLLEEHGFPFRYEAAVKTGSKTVYPDFLIKNPFTGRTILWEHFGALDQPQYAEKMAEKMRFYLKKGYVPFENLIYTFEFDVQVPARLKQLVLGLENV